MLKLGEIPQSANFYFMTDAVKAVIDNFKMGEDVTIQTKSEDGYEWITDIQKLTASQTGLANPTPKAVTPPVTPPPAPKAQGVATGSTINKGDAFNKPSGYLPRDQWIAKKKAEGTWKAEPEGSKNSPDVQVSIKRQAIGHMTTRAMISMQGIITPDNMEEIAERLYKKFVELVG